MNIGGTVYSISGERVVRLGKVRRRRFCLWCGLPVQGKQFCSQSCVMRWRYEADRPELNLRELERRAILRALRLVDYNQRMAAELLGITRRALKYRIAKYGIKHHKWPRNSIRDG